MVIPVPSLILDLFFIPLTLPSTSAFDRDSCFKKTQDLLSNHSISATGPLFFRDAFDSPPYHGVENMTLTLNRCNELCGSKQTWYTGVGPRMTVWLIPILILIANVEPSPLDKGRFLAVLPLLGDPIDSFCSLLHKLVAAFVPSIGGAEPGSS
jgi:hypothetical protein